MIVLAAQTRAELVMTLRRGESLLLTLGIPVLLLVFFSLVDVLPMGPGVGEPVDFLAPGVLALAVMSTSMVGLAIATGFERQYGVLKRLGPTPLGRPRLLVAKILAVLGVQAVQAVLLVGVALGLGWRPSAGGILVAVVAVTVATAAFAGMGLAMAGAWRAELVLAAANGGYLLLLLVSGMMIPLSELPAPVRAAARVLPSTALAEILHGALTAGISVPGRAWVVLVAWAVAAPLLAVRVFRWE